MNPFEKLKFTIDRIGLEYVPSNDQETVTGQSVYNYTRTKELQEADHHVPYFNTQGHNEQYFKKNSAQFRVQEIQELKAIYENQHKNLVHEIDSLNLKLKEFQMRFELKCEENQRLKQQIDSKNRQNTELRGYIVDLQQKNLRKLSESGVLQRQRKLKEEIDRINLTVVDLAKELNSQKSTRKGLQKQLDSFKAKYHELQVTFESERNGLTKEITLLKEELQKRTQLLEHSIKASRDQKVLHKEELASTKDKHEAKVDLLRQEIEQFRQEVFNLKNNITELNYLNSNLQKQLQTSKKSVTNLQSSLTDSQTLTTQLNDKLKASTEKIQELRLQIAYYQQQLEDQRSNTKVKVVEVRDESLEMELTMYKKQCRELTKQKSILESVMRGEKHDYTIVSENQVILNRSE